MNDLIVYSPPESKHSNLHKTASLAQIYTKELTKEIKPLLDRISSTYPRETGRLIGLLSEIDLMTSVTLSRIENLIKSD